MIRFYLCLVGDSNVSSNITVHTDSLDDGNADGLLYVLRTLGQLLASTFGQLLVSQVQVEHGLFLIITKLATDLIALLIRPLSHHV